MATMATIDDDDDGDGDGDNDDDGNDDGVGFTKPSPRLDSVRLDLLGWTMLVLSPSVA